MSDWIINWAESWGYVALAVLMFLENVLPPIPSELVMPLGGYLASQGELSLWGVGLAGTLGSVLGQLPLYYLGHAIGAERMRRLVERHRWMMVDASDLDRAERWFEQHGGKTVLLCRFVPGVRSLISIPAGISGMQLVPFLGYSAIGMGLWAMVLASVGWWLGDNYRKVGKWLGPAGTVVIVGLILAMAWRGWRRRQARSS